MSGSRTKKLKKLVREITPGSSSFLQEKEGTKRWVGQRDFYKRLKKKLKGKPIPKSGKDLVKLGHIKE